MNTSDRKRLVARRTFHFAHANAPWVDAVATFFRAITRERILRWQLPHDRRLYAAIKRYLAEHKSRVKVVHLDRIAASISANLEKLLVASG